ncbi:MAG: pentapeptide repeat-containing protein [Nitrospinales bacterium]
MVWNGSKEIKEVERQRESLNGAELTGVSLEGINLGGGNLRGAKLIRSYLMGANLMGANLSEANLTGANLWGAKLNHADLRGAKLVGTCLQSADLTQVKNLTANQLSQAIIDSNTIIPKEDEGPEEENSVEEAPIPKPEVSKKGVEQLRDEVLEFFEQSIKRQTEEAEETKKQLASLRAVLKEMAGDEGKHSKEVEDLKNQLSDLKEEQKKNKEEIKSLTAELESSKIKMQEAIDGSNQSAQLTLDLQNEIDGLKGAQANSILAQKEFESKLSGKDSEITNFKQQLEKESSSLKQLSSQLKEAQKKLSDNDPNELVRLKAEIVGLKRENDSLQKKVATQPVSSSTPASRPPIRKTAPTSTQQTDNKDEFLELNQAVKRNPRDTKALLQLADAYISKDRFMEAIPTLTNLAKLKPKDPEVHFKLGHTFFQAEKFQESIPPLNLAVRLNPKMAKAHYNLCMVNELVGQEDAASKHYKIALKLDPKIESSMQ